MGCFHSWSDYGWKTNTTKVDPKLPGIDASQKFTENLGRSIHGRGPLEGEIINDVGLDILAVGCNGAAIDNLINLF